MISTAIPEFEPVSEHRPNVKGALKIIEGRMAFVNVPEGKVVTLFQGGYCDDTRWCLVRLIETNCGPTRTEIVKSCCGDVCLQNDGMLPVMHPGRYILLRRAGTETDGYVRAEYHSTRSSYVKAMMPAWQNTLDNCCFSEQNSDNLKAIADAVSLMALEGNPT